MLMKRFILLVVCPRMFFCVESVLLAFWLLLLLLRWWWSLLTAPSFLPLSPRLCACVSSRPVRVAYAGQQRGGYPGGRQASSGREEGRPRRGRQRPQEQPQPSPQPFDTCLGGLWYARCDRLPPTNFVSHVWSLLGFIWVHRSLNALHLFHEF